MDTEKLLPEVMSQFALDPNGLHGLPHWARVLENALCLARNTAVNPEILELFAILHDARRISDGEDGDHGLRSGDLAVYCRSRGMKLDDRDFERLYKAIIGHNKCRLDPGDEVISICWDAERLDLPRLGLTPRPNTMQTETGRDPAVIEWAGKRSRYGYVPKLVETRWCSHAAMAG